MNNNMNEAKTKVCNKCGRKLTLNDFHKSSRAKDGRQSSCKDCKAKYHQKRYKNKKDHINKVNKKWRDNNKDYFVKWRNKNKEHYLAYKKEYHKQNRERNLEYMKSWRKRNYDYLIDYDRKRYKQNKEIYRKRSKIYKIKNKDKVNAYEQKRRNAKKDLPATLTTGQWIEIKQKFKNQCAYCGKEKELTQEHFVPLKKGGGYTTDNIIPACKSCNSSKQDKSFFEWYPEQLFYSEQRERRVLKHLKYNEDNEQQLSIL